MSRDIKFRAWNLVAIPKRMMSHEDICFYKDLKMYELFCDTLDNRPWIIMQYTGVKDKNGVEIYEFMEIDNLFEVSFYDGCYILTNISNKDIIPLNNYLKEKNGQVEVTREYTQV